MDNGSSVEEKRYYIFARIVCLDLIDTWNWDPEQSLVQPDNG